MVAIDSEFILIALILLSPIYVFLQKMSITLSKFTNIVMDCKYCRKNIRQDKEDKAENDD